jgi:hypothetical protein
MKTSYFTLLSILLTIIPAFAQNQYPGQGVLGKGYNVFGEYANNKSVMRYKLFDFSKMSANPNEFGHSTPDLVYIENISDHIINTIEGSSITEYSNQLSEKIGLGANAFFFKGSVDAQFKNRYVSSENLFYYTYMDINTKWRVSLDTRDTEKMISCLDQQFKRDLDSLDPKTLFELYGTHFVSSAYLGGRIDYSSVANISYQTSTAEIKSAIKAKYGIISGSYSEGISTENVLSESNTESQLSVVGGNAEYTNSITNKEQYKKWADGIAGSPVLCGFDKNSLLPIWMLTLDPKRKKELEEYFLKSILPLYPLPDIFQQDPTLDNENFVEKFNVYLKGFYVAQDCDNYLLTGDEAGDFKYNVSVYANQELMHNTKSESGKVYPVWSGKWLAIEELLTVEMPFGKQSTLEIAGSIREIDDLQEEVLGTKSNTHTYPFSESDLYNTELDGAKYYRIDYYYDTDCRALLYYHVSPFENETAFDYGNKGWEEYQAGDYEKAQYYNREALKLDNTLWFVQYNTALIYLIQKNPLAFEKYKVITNNCTDIETYKAALKDIVDYEKVHGTLDNSEQVKILLKSKT